MIYNHDNIIGIDHLAIAVPDLEQAIQWASKLLGFEIVERRETQGGHTGMKSAVMRLGPLTFVLMEGVGQDSQITRFVDKHGAGVQHVALRVRDIGSAIVALSQDESDPFSTPRLDSDGLSQIFVARDPATGLMIELIERRDDSGFSDENVHRLFESLEKQNLV
jgi:methylmalonyl-CoA/ethylmalonyl-CoA epimerase